jgi:hypothetical protein
MAGQYAWGRGTLKQRRAPGRKTIVSSARDFLKSRKALLVLAAVAIVAVGMALPRLFATFGEVDVNAVPKSQAAPPRQSIFAGREQPKPPEKPKLDVSAFQAPAGKPTVDTSKTGDLAVTLALRWPEFQTGERVLAKVKFSNHSTGAIHLPAPLEPNPGLAIVVQDAEGREVRRIVETGKGSELPHKLIKLAAGCEAQIQVVVVAEEETPLEPGKYTAWVEMTRDPLLPRLGLPVWTAPNGPIRSESVAFDVTAKTQ